MTATDDLIIEDYDGTYWYIAGSACNFGFRQG
jgi:hypothetical protein